MQGSVEPKQVPSCSRNAIGMTKRALSRCWMILDDSHFLLFSSLWCETQKKKTKKYFHFYQLRCIWNKLQPRDGCLATLKSQHKKTQKPEKWETTIWVICLTMAPRQKLRIMRFGFVFEILRCGNVTQPEEFFCSPNVFSKLFNACRFSYRRQTILLSASVKSQNVRQKIAAWRSMVMTEFIFLFIRVTRVRSSRA